MANYKDESDTESENSFVEQIVDPGENKGIVAMDKWDAFTVSIDLQTLSFWSEPIFRVFFSRLHLRRLIRVQRLRWFGCGGLRNSC